MMPLVKKQLGTDQHGNIVFEMVAPGLRLSHVRALYEVLRVRSTRYLPPHTTTHDVIVTSSQLLTTSSQQITTP